jgi:transposase
MSSNPITLYFRREPLAAPLTIGWLRAHLPEQPVWISLEPYPQLPERNGKRLRGAIPGLAPLMTCLPDPQWDDLPLASAAFFGPRHWAHLVAAQPLSEQCGAIFTWQLDQGEGFEAIPEVRPQAQPVLPWQDRHRFGLHALPTGLPQTLATEHFHKAGRRITWRIVPNRDPA